MRLLLAFSLIFLACADGAVIVDQRPAPTLTAKGARLLVSGRDDFLLGISLFDALGKTPPRDQDLDALRDWGIRIVRVWAHWSEPLYAPDGTLPAPARKRLVDLTTRLADRGLLLELVALRPGQLPGQRFAAFGSDEARARAVREVAGAVERYDHVLIDLYNEHDHPDGPVSHVELRRLRDLVKAADPNRLVTVSSSEYHFLKADGSLDDAGRRNLREEVLDVAVDLVAAHLPRTPDWAASTASRVRTLKDALRVLGRDLPLYLNEEQRARPEAAIEAALYVTASNGARDAGAAGWVFHTAAAYDLTRMPLMQALAADEKKALELLAAPRK